MSSEKLTPNEAAYLDHMAYEAMVLEGEAPAHRWFGERGMDATDLLNLEIAREKERGGPRYDPPTVPLAFPWKDAEEVRNRNTEFASEANALKTEFGNRDAEEGT